MHMPYVYLYVLCDEHISTYICETYTVRTGQCVTVYTYVLYIEHLDAVSAHLDALIRDVADVRDLLDGSRGQLSSSPSAGMPY